MKPKLLFLIAALCMSSMLIIANFHMANATASGLEQCINRCQRDYQDSIDELGSPPPAPFTPPVGIHTNVDEFEYYLQQHEIEEELAECISDCFLQFNEDYSTSPRPSNQKKQENPFNTNSTLCPFWPKM